MRSLFALFALLALLPSSAWAGPIIVSGDENITNPLVGNSIAVNPGNQRFFANVLGAGTRVVVQGTDVSAFDAPVTNINTFYNTLPGVTSTIQAGLVTPASLAGVNLFVSAIPATPFTAAEVAALGAFSTAGGSIFLLGDGATFPPGALGDTNLNALLVGLGSGLRILPANLDSGFRTVGGSQIASTPLTTGVTSFTYAFTSQVTGGTPQFFTSGGQTFIAAEGVVGPGPAPIPEPATLAVFGLVGAAGFGYVRRRLTGAPVAA